MRVQETVEIAASPERVWGVISDIGRWPEWTPTVTAIELLDPGALRVGQRARLAQRASGPRSGP